MTTILPPAAAKRLIAAALALEAEAAALRAIAEADARHADENSAGGEKRNAPTVLHKGSPVGPLTHGIPTAHVLNAARRSTNAPGGYL